MNLYLIKMKRMADIGENEGFVIRCVTEQKARFLAANQAEEEGTKTWLDPSKSRVEILAEKVRGKENIILSSYWGG